MPASKPSVFPFFLDVFKKRVEGAVFKKLSAGFYSSPALLHALLNRVAFFVEVFNGLKIEPVKIRRAINLQPLDSTQNVFAHFTPISPAIVRAVGWFANWYPFRSAQFTAHSQCHR